MQGLGGAGGEGGEGGAGGEAPRNRSARCAACYGFCMGNACIFGLVGLLLGVLAFDGFTANEIDYWYPVRPRPRTA